MGVCCACAANGHPVAAPIPAINSAASFDYLVGALLKMQRHFESKRFGGPEVDNQLEFDGCLNGKLARLLALEDAINIGRGQPKLVTLVAAVGKQPPGLG